MATVVDTFSEALEYYNDRYQTALSNSSRRELEKFKSVTNQINTYYDIVIAAAGEGADTRAQDALDAIVALLNAEGIQITAPVTPPMGICFGASPSTIQIPTAADGSNPVYSNAFADVYIMEGRADITDSFTYTITAQVNCAATIALERVTITSITDDTGYVEVTGTQTGYDDVVINVPVKKTKTSDIWSISAGDIYYNAGQVGIGRTGSNYLLEVVDSAIPVNDSTAVARIGREGNPKTVNDTDFGVILRLSGDTLNNYNIASGVTDTGRRTGLEIEMVAVYPNLDGNLDEQFGIDVSTGDFGGGSTGAVTLSACINMEHRSSSVTYTNKYILHSTSDVPSYLEGSLGLGVASPSAKLEVARSAGGEVAKFGISTDDALRVAYDLATKIASVYNYADSDYADLRLGHDTDASKMIYIDVSSGRIGIGTDTPQRSLDVNGGIYSGSIRATSSDGSIALWANSGVVYRAALAHFTTAGGYLHLVNDSDQLMCEINGYAAGGIQGYFLAGNIGVGTSSPSELFEVEGGNLKVENTDGSIALYSAGGGVPRVSLNHSNGDGGYIDILDDSNNVQAKIRGYAASNVQAYFLAGRVGINTDTPEQLLHVVGSVYAESGYFLTSPVRVFESGSGTSSFTPSGGSNILRITAETENDSDNLTMDVYLTNFQNVTSLPLFITICFNVLHNTTDITVNIRNSGGTILQQINEVNASPVLKRWGIILSYGSHDGSTPDGWNKVSGVIETT